MEKIKEYIISKITNLSKDDFDKPIESLGIDSIDFVTLRVDLDEEFNREINDDVWLTLKCLNDIIEFYSSEIKEIESKPMGNEVTSNVISDSSYKVNMPQMALEGLSENWLFKEIGDVHWAMLTDGLGVSSFNLKDALDNRLYATFVRIRYHSNNSLKDFKENDSLKKESEISRFGDSMYFSAHQLYNDHAEIKMELMTTFATRGKDNTKLTKGKPGKILINKIGSLNEFPRFGVEYKQIRKNEIEKLYTLNYKFDITEDVLFQTEYDINPYTDLNGVNLLYFAAYPVISDFCESMFFNEQESFKNGHWAQTGYAVFKDVFYHNNCNISDSIIYKLHSFKYLDDEHIQIISSLTRKRDDALMARIFSVKKIIL